jgi:hypothetical protein
MIENNAVGLDGLFTDSFTWVCTKCTKNLLECLFYNGCLFKCMRRRKLYQVMAVNLWTCNFCPLIIFAFTSPRCVDTTRLIWTHSHKVSGEKNVKIPHDWFKFLMKILYVYQASLIGKNWSFEPNVWLVEVHQDLSQTSCTHCVTRGKYNVRWRHVTRTKAREFSSLRTTTIINKIHLTVPLKLRKGGYCEPWS